MYNTKVFSNFSTGTFPVEITDKNQGWIYDINFVLYNKLANFLEYGRVYLNDHTLIINKLKYDLGIFSEFTDSEIDILNNADKLFMINDADLEILIGTIYNDYINPIDMFIENMDSRISNEEYVSLFNLLTVDELDLFIESKDLSNITELNINENIEILFNEFELKDTNG